MVLPAGIGGMAGRGVSADLYFSYSCLSACAGTASIKDTAIMMAINGKLFFFFLS